MQVDGTEYTVLAGQQFAGQLQADRVHEPDLRELHLRRLAVQPLHRRTGRQVAGPPARSPGVVWAPGPEPGAPNLSGPCSATSPPGNRTARPWWSWSRAARRAHGDRRRDRRRARPAPPRLRARPPDALRARRRRAARRRPPRHHARIAGVDRDPQHRVAEVAGGDVARAGGDREAAHPAPPGPRRPRRDAEVRLRRRPQRARARQRPRDRGPGGGRRAGEGAARRARDVGALARRAHG